MTLGSLAARLYQGINTAADKVKYQNFGHHILQSKHITGGKVDRTGARYLSEADFEKYAQKYNPTRGSILLTNIGTLGKSVFLREDTDFLIAWNIFLVQPKEYEVGEFLCFYLRHLDAIEYFPAHATGNATKFINKKTLESIQVPLPSKEERAEIVCGLNALENALEATDRELETCRRLKSALMSVLLTGQVRVTPDEAAA